MRWLYEAVMGPPPHEAAAGERFPFPPPRTPPGSGRGKKKGKQKPKKIGLQTHLTVPLGGMEPPTGPGGDPPQYEGIHFPWHPYYQFLPKRRSPIVSMETRAAALHTDDVYKWDWESTENSVLPQTELWRTDIYSGMAWLETTVEDVSLDKWNVFWKMPDPLVRMPVHLQQDYEFDLAALEQVTLDKWFSQGALPVVRPPVTWVQNWDDLRDLADQIETITVDKWHPAAPVVIRQSPWTVPWSTAVDPEPIPDEDLTAYMIWQTPMRPPIELRHALRPIVAGNLHPEELGETVSVAALGEMGEPVRPGPWPMDRLHRDWNQPFETETITIDKWYTPMGYEFRSPLPVMPLPSEVVPSGDLEQVTLDKWYTPLDTPVLPETPLTLHQYPMDPLPIPPVPGFDEFYTGYVPVVWPDPVPLTMYYAHQDLNHERPIQADERPVRRRRRE